MSGKLEAIVLGGLLPALFYGLVPILQKWSTGAGISVGLYLVCLGAATVAVGGVLTAILPDQSAPLRSILPALGAGVLFATAAGLIALALVRHDAAISQLAPLYNMNTLITVLLGLWLFSEFREVDATRLIAGGVLVVAGGALVARA